MKTKLGGPGKKCSALLRGIRPKFVGFQSKIDLFTEVVWTAQHARFTSTLFVMLTHRRPAMPFGNRKKYLEDLFSSIISKVKKYHPSGNLKFNNLGIFQSSKLHNFTGKILRISLKLNLTPNTWSCYGLIRSFQISSHE